MPTGSAFRQVRHDALNQVKSTIKRKASQNADFKQTVMAAGGECAYAQRQFEDAEKAARLAGVSGGIAGFTKIGVKPDMAEQMVQALRQQQPTEPQMA